MGKRNPNLSYDDFRSFKVYLVFFFLFFSSCVYRFFHLYEFVCVLCWFNRFSGKVHGSLARAGKVRGQTPKVAKQDKKKKPRGRAHKRMQYNRRFVTAGKQSLLNSFVFSNVLAV